MWKFIAFTAVTRRARHDKVVRKIRTTARNRNYVINVIFIANTFTAIVALSALSAIYSLNVGGAITSGRVELARFTDCGGGSFIETCMVNVLAIPAILTLDYRLSVLVAIFMVVFSFGVFSLAAIFMLIGSNSIPVFFKPLVITIKRLFAVRKVVCGFLGSYFVLVFGAVGFRNVGFMRFVGDAISALTVLTASAQRHVRTTFSIKKVVCGRIRIPAFRASFMVHCGFLVGLVRKCGKVTRLTFYTVHEAVLSHTKIISQQLYHNAPYLVLGEN